MDPDQQPPIQNKSASHWIILISIILILATVIVFYFLTSPVGKAIEVRNQLTHCIDLDAENALLRGSTNVYDANANNRLINQRDDYCDVDDPLFRNLIEVSCDPQCSFLETKVDCDFGCENGACKFHEEIQH